MTSLLVRRPHWRDIGELAARLRQADRDELAALGHPGDPTPLLAEGVRASTMALAALRGDHLLCIFGVAPLRPHLLTEHVGVPWLLGTDALFAEGRSLISLPGPYIRQMLERYSKLVNVVHADNTRAVRWLRRMGFRLDDPAPFGPHGALFHRFEMTRDV